MVTIRFDKIRIESLSDSSSVNTGVNIVTNRASRQETNEAFGSVGGSFNEVVDGSSILKRGMPSARREARS